MVAFLICWGSFASFGMILSPLFEGIFTASQISIIGAIFVISGVFGSFSMGLFLDKTKKVLFGLRLVTTSVASTCMIGFGTLLSETFFLNCMWALLLGFTIFAILPTAFGYTTKICGTIKPAVVNGFMMSGAFIYTFIVSLSASILLGYGRLIGYGLLAVLSLIAPVCALWIKDNDANRIMERSVEEPLNDRVVKTT